MLNDKKYYIKIPHFEVICVKLCRLKMIESSTLYIVATPIGNLLDISPRAIEILKHADKIYAEDTRHSKTLMQSHAIMTDMQALHEHNEQQQVAQILQRLKAGESIAIISDAGTPLISDPGFFIVQAVRQAGWKVSPVPGACAAIAALSASGLASDRFTFNGFIPAKKEARRKFLATFLYSEQTNIFYESPHRILVSLADMISVFGEERRICFARELTKQFETIKLASLSEILAFATNDPNQQKGEIVLILEKSTAMVCSEKQALSTLKLLMEELPASQASKIAAKLTGLKKKQLYQLILDHNL